MKSIGVIRRTDPMGRIVLPKEVRNTHRIDVGTPLEIFVDENLIVLRKYQASRACLVTGEVLSENKEYANGIFLSQKGSEILLNKLSKMHLKGI